MPNLYTAKLETKDGRLVHRADVECYDAFMVEVTETHIEYRRRRTYSKMFEPIGKEHFCIAPDINDEDGSRLYILSRMFANKEEAEVWLRDKLFAHNKALADAAFDTSKRCRALLDADRALVEVCDNLLWERDLDGMMDVELSVCASNLSSMWTHNITHVCRGHGSRKHRAKLKAHNIAADAALRNRRCSGSVYANFI